MKKILIFTTFDNFYLKDLLIRLSKIPNYKFTYILINEHQSLRSILMRLFTLGIFNSVKFLIINLFKILKKDILEFNLKRKNILYTKDNTEIIKFINNNKVDLILSINYPKKIDLKVLKATKFGGINSHLGKLPNYSGRFPVIRALMNKEKYIYTTTHFMDESFDTARIIDEKKLKISKQNIVQIYLRIYQIVFQLNKA